LGITYVGLNEYGKAEEQFQQMVSLAPDDAAGYNNLANLYIIAGRTDDAVSSYEKARELSPDDPGIYLNLGLGYVMTNKPTESQNMLSQAFEQLGDYKAAFNLVGVPSEEPVAKAAVAPLLADEIRSLFVNAAEGADVEVGVRQLRARADEAGRENIYFYWKR
jgi:Flp pilus assembly protein TadD